MTQHTTQNSRRAAGLEDLFTFLDPSGNSIPGTNTPSHLPTPENMSSQPESTHIETLDETPDETLGTTNHEAKAFAKAIDKIVKANYGSSKSKPKLWEPDPFDGSDSQKLHTFILQCKLNFRDRPDQFQDNTTKVNYILSHLKGSTLDCFKPALLIQLNLYGFRTSTFSLKNSKPILEPMIQSVKQKLNLKDFACMKVIRLRSILLNFSS